MRANALLGHAAELLRQALRAAEPPDAVVQSYVRRRSYLGSKERRFVAEVVFATLRCLGTLRWCIQRVGAFPGLPASEELSLVVAMGFLGVQLGHPHLGPAFAVAAQLTPFQDAVDLWASVGVGTAQEVRCWLEALQKQLCALERAVGRILATPWEAWEQGDWELVAAACSMPAWILRSWLDNPWLRLSAGEVFRLARALCLPASPCLRVNTLRASREEVVSALRQYGIAAVPTPFSPVGVRLWERIALHELRLYREGIVEVQDEGSQLVGYALLPQPEWRVWDACAGAGGKTLHLAALQGDRGQIWATDVDIVRLRALRHRLHRAGVKSVRIVHLRNGQLPREVPRRVEALLIDAPCSGIGTARRSPLLKWRVTPETLKRHSRRQLQLLEAYAPRVISGGVLVYATCSLMPEENGAVVAEFLRRHPEWELEPLEPVFRRSGIVLPWIAASESCLLLPSVHGTDGFFIARLRRQ